MVTLVYTGITLLRVHYKGRYMYECVCICVCKRMCKCVYMYAQYSVFVLVYTYIDRYLASWSLVNDQLLTKRTIDIALYHRRQTAFKLPGFLSLSLPSLFRFVSLLLLCACAC
ncbi:hypothetical protein BDF19DRAFT_431199 [Syncephalis fuscata]|nr:hypothetical protein BDF19DRAFT_431199 [Syncephalis fuscata]